MEKPELYQLTRIKWQFFGTLTFASASLPERVRISMWFALVRKTAANLGLYFPNIPWCLRQEDGETTGRRHFHYLLGGVPERAVTVASCFVQMAEWEKLRGGMARVRLFDPTLNGVDYLAKECQMSGADLYESAKFGAKSSGLMLSKAAQALLERVIREERRHIKRLEKTRPQAEVSQAKTIVCVPPRQMRRQVADALLARGDVSSTGHTLNMRAFKDNPYAFVDLVDDRATYKAEKAESLGKFPTADKSRQA